MSSQEHVIQKLTVEIGLPDQQEAFALQTKITGEYQRLILSAMNEVFDSLVTEDETVVIDRLEIDLGHVAAQSLDEEFPPKVKKEIEEALSKLLFEARSANGVSADIRITTSAGDAISVRAKVQHTSRSSFELLVYFLQYGILPWSADRKQKPRLSVLVSEAMIHHPDELRTVLQRNRQRYVFRRLAFQLPADQLQYLAAILGSGFSSALDELTQSVYKWMQAYADQHPEKIKQGFNFSSTLKQLIWEETLFYFAANTGALQNTQGEEAKIAYVTKMLERLFLLAGTSPDRLSVKYVKGDFSSVVAKSLERWLNVNETPAQKAKAKRQGAKGLHGGVDPDNELLQEEDNEEGGELAAGKAKKEKAAGRKNKKDETASRKNKKDETAGDPKNKSGRAEEHIEEGQPKLFKSKTEEDLLPEAPELEEGVYINNAGLVILAAYLPGFFRNLGLVVGKEFTDDTARWKAVHMLQWLVDGDRTEEDASSDKNEETELTEHDLLLNKIFCGLDSAAPVPASIELTAKDKEEGINLIKAIIANWSIIKNSSVHTVRTTFLQKEGRLKKEGENWSLYIHRDSAVDMLIDKLPWSISMIKLPWNEALVYVEW